MRPWTIKGIPIEARNAAIAAAARDGMTIGAWIERAIRDQVKGDRARAKLPALVEDVAPPAIPSDVFDTLNRACDIAHKLTGDAVPARLRNQIMRAVHEHVRRTVRREPQP